MNNFYINKRVNPKGLKPNVFNLLGRDEYGVGIIGAEIGGLTCGGDLGKL